MASQPVALLDHLLPHSTDRLVLRRFAAGDLESFIGYRSDPVVARYQGWSSLSRQQAAAFIQEMQQSPIGVPGEWFQVAIAERQSNGLLGDIGVQVQADFTTAEVGFTLARSAQGQGYAREAVQAFLSLLFASDIEQVVCITDARNAASIRLLERLGMQRTRSVETVFRGEQCTEHYYRLERP